MTWTMIQATWSINSVWVTAEPRVLSLGWSSSATSSVTKDNGLWVGGGNKERHNNSITERDPIHEKNHMYDIFFSCNAL